MYPWRTVIRFTYRFIRPAGFFAALLLFFAIHTHADGYVGGEFGYNQSGNSFQVGFRYLNSITIGGWKRPMGQHVGKPIFDIQPSLGISTGFRQVLRVEGGINFGVGASFEGDTAFSFVLIGIHAALNLTFKNIASGDRLSLGIGPSFILPLSVNIYWHDFFFGVHWGVDAEWASLVGKTEPLRFSLNTPLFVRFTIAYDF